MKNYLYIINDKPGFKTFFPPLCQSGNHILIPPRFTGIFQTKLLSVGVAHFFIWCLLLSSNFLSVSASMLWFSFVP